MNYTVAMTKNLQKLTQPFLTKRKCQGFFIVSFCKHGKEKNNQINEGHMPDLKFIHYLSKKSLNLLLLVSFLKIQPTVSLALSKMSAYY